MNELKKILYIDDDTMMRMMVQKSLERSNKGFEIVSCATSSEFLSSLRSFIPDLLIIDVVMPFMDGPTILAEVRNLSYTTPAIFLTGHEQFEPENKADLQPIIGTIQKPFASMALGDELLKMWEAHLSR